jgi:adenylate kinase
MTNKNMVIAITGTPAVGKSTFGKLLAEELPNSMVIELNDLVDQYKLFSGIDELGARIVKIKELEKKTKELIKEHQKNSNIIIVGHLAPELRIDLDLVIVLRAKLKELIKRLEERGYSIEKVRENLISESIDYCGEKSMDMCREVYEVENEKEKKEILKYIKDRYNNKETSRPEKKEISKLDELLELVTEGNRYGL